MHHTINERSPEYIVRWFRETGFLKVAAGVVPAASAFGVICLTIYYATLNFTPDISFAQGALVAVQAGILGATLLGSIWVSLSMSALTYQFLGIRPSELVPKHRKVATKHLVSRYIWTQLASIGLISIFVYFPHREKFEYAISWGVSIIVFVWASVHVVFSPLIWGPDGLETRGTFVASVFVVGFAAAVSLLTLLAIRSGSPGAHSDARFLLTFGMVVVLGCTQVALAASDLALLLGVGAVLLLEVAFLLGSPPAYIRGTSQTRSVSQRRLPLD
ncbi:hypothetical protein VSR68_25070 [Paraburkholderia phymatum]|uniref:hypothetical protein n=1 Tax=Paraburkholderia phymatum TaxID=148447 RepID=UPI00316FD1AA